MLASTDIKVLLFAASFLHLLIYLLVQSTVVTNPHSVIRMPGFKSQIYHLTRNKGLGNLLNLREVQFTYL